MLKESVCVCLFQIYPTNMNIGRYQTNKILKKREASLGATPLRSSLQPGGRRHHNNEGEEGARVKESSHSHARTHTHTHPKTKSYHTTQPPQTPSSPTIPHQASTLKQHIETGGRNHTSTRENRTELLFFIQKERRRFTPVFQKPVCIRILNNHTCCQHSLYWAG